ncbi:MAG: hypothetical protein HXX09_08065 [Bacteroidetes bacterium]|nr:hypothetical protein [Bacteroidota bacterium]
MKQKIILLLKSSFSTKNIIGLILGAIGGFLYYTYYGCASGTCPLSSNPWITTIWGATMGYLLFGMFDKKEKPITEEENEK